MSLKYILGGAGTGKTEYAFDEMLKAKDIMDKDKNIIYLVPEQYTLVGENKLIEKSENKAIMQMEVLSFQRLAYRIFSFKGVKKPNNLDNTGKAMLVRKAIIKSQDSLKYYVNTGINPGFIEKVCNIISEIYEYNINIDEILEEELNQVLRYKLEDIQLIYKNYLGFIEENYVVTDEVLDLLANSIKDAEFLENSHIWIDNFSGFTPQEYNVILELIKKAKEVNICLTVKSNKIYHDNLRNTDIFFEVKKSINKITEMANENNINILEPVYLNNNYRFENREELYFLENNFFNYATPRYPEDNNRINIYGADNRYDELEWMASKIVYLVREEGYKYSDIGILCSNIDSYSGIIEYILKKYSIPYFLDTRLDIISHPLTELVRSIVEIPLKNYSYESVFRFLKSGLIPIDKNDIDMIENYALAYGIRGKNRWEEEWEYGFSENSYYNKEKSHETKEEILKYIDIFTKDLNKKEKAENYIIRIYELFEELEIKTQIERLYDKANKEKDLVMIKKHSGIWNNLINVFDSLIEIFGENEMDIEEFHEILETGILSNDLGMIPPFKDSITFGDVYRSRLSEIKVIFVIGVLENEFPRRRSEDSLLLDTDREKLEKLGVELAPNSTQLIFNDNFLIYSTITKARDYLYFSYPQGDIEGKALFKSSLITRLENMFSFKEEKKELITLPVPMLEDLAVAIGEFERQGSTDDFSMYLIKWFENSNYSGYVDRFKIIPNIKLVEKLKPETTKEIYKFNEIKTSITRLEKYRQCPFAFFAQYNLDLKERQIFKIGGLDMGNLFHNILEEFSIIIEKNNISWDKLNENDIEKYLDIAFENIIERFPSDIFLNTARNRYILDRAKSIAEKSIWALSEHMKKGSFKAYGAEVDFGLSSPITGIEIDINNEYKLILTGKIDRIDIYDSDGQAYLKIIDYKTGRASLDYNDIYYGMQLQLLIYMNALMEKGNSILDMETKLLPGGVFYFRIDDPIVDYEDIRGDVETSILKAYGMSGLVYDDEKSIVALDNGLSEAKYRSDIIPVYRKADGEFSSNFLADEEKYESIMDHSINKAKEIGRHMIEGNIKPLPYKKDSNNYGCKYCNYKGICYFDPKEDEYDNWQLKKTIEDF